MGNLTYEQRKADLIEEITAAFDGVSRENGVSLSEAWEIDDYGSVEEREEARKQDTETRWQDVPDEHIRVGDSPLSFMDEIGFHYYIPAYMVWYLRYLDVDDTELQGSGNTFDFPQHHLCLSNDYSIRKRSLVKFKRFTREQSKAVAHFLQFADELEKKFELKMEQIDLENMAKERCSAKEVEAKNQGIEKRWIKRKLQETKVKEAIREYWGQFL